MKFKIKKKKKKIPKSKIKKNKSKTTITKNRKKTKRKLWKKLLSLFLVCCALGVFAIFAFCVYIMKTSGEFDPNKLANQDQTVIYDSKNNVIAKLGIEKRESVNYDDLPQVLVDAIIATEDSRYFKHNGVDGARFLKASVGQLMGNSSAGGASTLTMQVVKNNLTSTEQTITRKFKDIYLAVFFMEEKYTKQEILEFYVNDSLLGGNVYGVEEASKYYFGKSVSELSLPEAAIIAGLFQSPNGYNPYLYPEKTAKRRKTVLNLMVKHGYITKEEAEIANNVDVSSLLVGKNEDTKYQGFIDTVVAEVIKKTKNDPAIVSMEIHTTMDPIMQDGIDSVLAGNGYKWQDDKVQAGVTILDVNTGAITAIGTGRNRNGERVWNYATQSKRQPGSTAKPIFAYGPGFQYANFSTYQLFNDEEWAYTDGTGLGNWDSGYKGLMTLREALSISRNIPALKAFQEVQAAVGNKKIVEFVENLGIDLENDIAYESYSIGGMSQGVTTVQMAAAYAAFANGGYYTEPYTVTSITYRETGETLELEHTKKQAMDEAAAYLVTNVLEHAAKYGFHGGTKQYAGTVAVKTGTSNYTQDDIKKHKLPANAVNDLWSVAYTPQYSIALWYGYDKIDNKYYNTMGSPKDALMTAIMKHIPVTKDAFKKPSSVVATQVESETWPAQLPSEYTPQALIKTEYFRAGTEPTEVSNRFEKLKDVTNIKASASLSGLKLTWDKPKIEQTDEEYLKKYFSQHVFGNSSSKFLTDRINYNNNTLGGIGYGIYLKTNDKLTSIGFTTDNSFTYKGTLSRNSSIVIKTEYKNFKNNASSGATANLSNIDFNLFEDTTETDEKLTIKLISDNATLPNDYPINNYKEEGIIVTLNNKNITSKCTITYVLNNIEYQTKQELENQINSITESTTIKLTYKVKYIDEDKTLTDSISKTITLK